MPETCPHVAVITCLSPAGHDGPHRTGHPVDAADYLAQVRREALNEAADRWLHGEWGSTPRYANRVADRMGAAQYFGDWLRKQAEEPPR